jgi:hypothetical protein
LVSSGPPLQRRCSKLTKSTTKTKSALEPQERGLSSGGLGLRKVRCVLPTQFSFMLALRSDGRP